MTDGIARRRFLTQLTCALSVSATGGSLAWWASAVAEPLQRKTPSGDLLETVPRGELPSFAKKGGPKVEAVYRYAVAHGETLQYIPCVCGCGAIGHRHNRMLPQRRLQLAKLVQQPDRVQRVEDRLQLCLALGGQHAGGTHALKWRLRRFVGARHGAALPALGFELQRRLEKLT